MDNDMIVYVSHQYTKTKIGNRKIVNDIFELFECVGEGSFWKVYLVQRNLINEDVLDNNFYVFKEGKLSQGCYDYSNEEEFRRGVREYLILSEVNNNNISRLYECIMDSDVDKIVLVMEYADLGELMKIDQNEEKLVYNIKLINFILKECLNEEIYFEDDYKFNFEKDYYILIKTSKFIFKQLAKAIDYLHDKNIYHRDIKPDNISMRSQDKNIKLLDFSISRKLKTKDELIQSDIGTPAFDPPEVSENEMINPFKVDIYSFGATLFVYLFNDLDFNLEKIKNNFKQIFKETDNLNLLLEFLNKLLQNNPDNRPEIKQILESEFFNL